MLGESGRRKKKVVNAMSMCQDRCFLSFCEPQLYICLNPFIAHARLLKKEQTILRSSERFIIYIVFTFHHVRGTYETIGIRGPLLFYNVGSTLILMYINTHSRICSFFESNNQEEVLFL